MTLKEKMVFEFEYKVPENKTVPFIFPEFEEGGKMPKVFATGYLVALFEFACIKFINKHIDWPNEQSVGIGVDISHTAATPPGFTIKIVGTLEEIKGKKLVFSIVASDGVDEISKGTHTRFIIDAKSFDQNLEKKIKKL